MFIIAAALGSWLSAHGVPPVDYVAGKVRTHQIVILGEAHWIAHDAQLVADLVPALADANAVLAMETLPSSEQATIDGLISAAEWDDETAIAVHRKADWPYREYVDILRAAWKAKVRVVALGPPPDFREKNIEYDAFMAQLVAQVAGDSTRVLVFCGLHHAFTHYYQPELDLKQRPYAYMDRMGNKLWRKYGRRVFMILLHRPFWCGDTEPLDYCLPLGGDIDCAGLSHGRAVGFDLEPSPIGRRELEPHIYYARAQPRPRLLDLADGYIWFRPLEEYRPAQQIPAEGEKLPQMKDIMSIRGWTALSNWRERCAQ